MSVSLKVRGAIGLVGIGLVVAGAAVAWGVAQALFAAGVAIVVVVWRA